MPTLGMIPVVVDPTSTMGSANNEQFNITEIMANKAARHGR
jgi:hypothetical protein